LIGTVSKSLSPALRLGWVLCPPALLDAVVAEKAQDDRGSLILEQLALTTLIRSGRFDRHLPAGVDERAVAAAAAERSVGLYPMSRYRADRAREPPQLVIGFGNLTEPTITRGIATVGDLLG
jgi:GntR family transcriptional regulator / MocR family aminotransferase